MQHGLNTVTRNSTDGDQFNVKAGTAEILTAALSLTTYGTPTAAAPLVFQGYTSAAGDGGRGEISGAGSFSIISPTTLDYIHFWDMKLSNGGTGSLLQLDDHCSLVRCEIGPSSLCQTTCVVLDQGVIADCYLHDYGVNAALSCNRLIIGNYIKVPSGNNASTHVSGGIGGTVIGNIIDCQASNGAGGIGADRHCNISYNTVYANGSTKTGIGISAGDAMYIVKNNIVVGFSGVGGTGFTASAYSAGLGAPIFAGNAFYNNTTHYNLANMKAVFEADNVILGSSPFVDAANGNFNLNSAVTDVIENAWPRSWPGLTTSTAPKPDKGAVQAGAGAGGATLYHRISRVLGR